MSRIIPYQPEEPEHNAERKPDKPSTIDLSPALMSAKELLAAEIPQRPKVLGEWLREGDYGYLFAPRGHGKSWLAMMIANAIANGTSLGEWSEGDSARRVVYFDAEMNLPDVQERGKLVGIDSDNFAWLQHEKVFPIIERQINIALREDQEAISAILADGDVLIIDNLSTSTSGIEENNGDHFDLLKGWFLELRNRRITVLVVHHAGRNGMMRGTSKREDIAHWILSLRDDSADGDQETAFLTTFAKCRNCQAASAPALRWTIKTIDRTLQVGCTPYSGMDAMPALVADGLQTARELAEALNVTPGCISKWARKLAKEDPPRIKIEGRRYIAPDGF